MFYDDIRRHRHYPTDLSTDKKMVSAEGFRNLALADTITCSATGQLRMLAKCLESCDEDSNTVHAVIDTLEAIAEDLSLAKIAIEYAASEREVAKNV